MPRSSTRLDHRLRLIEAALYVSGRPVEARALGAVLGIKSEERVKRLARTLRERYESLGAAMEVVELPGGRYVMQLKPEYAHKVRKLARRPLLTPGPLRTLSFIAMRQPVTQAYVVKVRGSPAYDHLKQLREMGLINMEKLGRTKMLRTTAAFADQFNLSRDVNAMKRQLRKLFDELSLSEGGHPKSSA